MHLRLTKPLLLPIIFATSSSIASESHEYFVKQVEHIEGSISSNFQKSHEIGDLYDVASGTVKFKRKDISVPGNSNLEVAYSLTYETAFPDYIGWVEDIPRIEIFSGVDSLGGNNAPTSWLKGSYCSGSFRHNHNGISMDVLGRAPKGHNSQIFYDRPTLKIPSENINEYLLENNGSLISNVTRFPYVTKSNWRFECSNSNSSGQEGFIATSPNGLIYHFDYKTNFIGALNGTKPNQPFSSSVDGAGLTLIDRTPIAILATKIEDRFGNWVQYKYKTNGSTTNIDQIISNDGRKITAVRNSNGVTISSSGKTWKYDTKDNSSGTTSGSNRNSLTVTQPDGLKWIYNLDASENVSSVDSDGNPICGRQFKPDRKVVNQPMTVISPYGMTTNLNFEFIRSDRSNIYSTRFQRKHDYMRCHYSYVLKEKSVRFGNELTTEKYEYSQTDGLFDIEAANPHQTSLISNPVPIGIDRANNKTVTKQFPDGSKVKYYINRKFRTWEFNTLSAIEYFNPQQSEAVLTEIYKYTPSVPKGESYQLNKDIFEITPRLIELKKEYDNGDIATETYSDFNEFDTPSIKKFTHNATGETLYFKNNYIHDLENWMLNLPNKSYVSETLVFAAPSHETNYNSLYQPFQEIKFGKVIKTHSFHSDGNLFKTTYSDSNRYEQYENYYRGKARKITLPCPTTNGCNNNNGSTTNTVVALLEVNDDGSTKSVTDYNGNKTSYSHSPLGWLTKVDYADPKWSDRVISYDTVGFIDDGIRGSNIFVGSLRQTISEGNFERKVYHDGLLRPIFTQTQDKADPTTVIYQRNKYDHENRVTLASFASSNAADLVGMQTEYDALGRVINQIRTSDHATTRTQYLSGNKIVVSDPMNNTTTTSFLAATEIAYDKPTLIEAPNSDDIIVDYNIYGQPTSIRQGKITETRLYDDYQQLCKIIRPETGITAYSYNTQSQLIWRALGTKGSTKSCDASAVPAADKVIMSYNNQDMIDSEIYPDTTPDQTYRYDSNGNLIRLQAGSTNWSYEYNSRNYIDKETLTLDGKSFVLDWEYDGLGAISSLKYPSGNLVKFTPNALGQPTMAGAYATDVKYHPNGKIKQFTYGNGIVRNVTFDSTGRIDSIIDKNRSMLLSLDPSYDDNDNLIGLIDWVDRKNDIKNLTYDGQNRLLTADGRWGKGRYTYDGKGNILSRSLNNNIIDYQYDSSNRLNRLSGAYAYTYQYDNSGKVTNNGRYSISYNLGQKITSAKGIKYIYDGHGRRVNKIISDRNNYSIYNKDGKLLHRQAENGIKTDVVYIGKQLVAEVDFGTESYIEFEKFNQQPICKQVPIPGSRKTKQVCSEGKKGFSWKTNNVKSCSGQVERSVGSRVSGTTPISGLSGSLRFGSQYVLKVTITCLTHNNETKVENFNF